MQFNFEKEISKEALNALPLVQFSGKIVMIDNITDADIAAEKLANERVLGFDTESKPVFQAGGRNRIALLQLSTLDTAYLFKTIKIGVPDSVKKILSNPEIIKAGAAVKDDVNGLRKLKSFEPAGFVELQKLSLKYGIENNALSKMAGIVLGFRISKAEQLSNWELMFFTEAQKRYAATDAWVGLLIYRALVYGEKFEI